MDNAMVKTEERIIPGNTDGTEDHLIYLRHLFAYNFAKDMIKADSLILEIGCGEGYGTSLLSNSCKEIIGLDIEESVIEHASKKYSSNSCSFNTYNGKQIPHPDNTFDAVICFQTIEHIKDDKEFILEVYRTLKKGGVLILTTPNRLNRLKPGQKPWNKFHVREYSPEDLKTLLQSQFSNIDIMGIIGSDEVQRIELKRLKKYGLVASYDIFNLRRFMPGQLKNLIKRSRIIFRGNNKTLADKFTLADIHATKNELNMCLDILAVCVK